MCQPFLGFSQIDFPDEASTRVETGGEVENDRGAMVFRLRAWNSLAKGQRPSRLNVFESYLAVKSGFFAADAASDGSLG